MSAQTLPRHEPAERPHVPGEPAVVVDATSATDVRDAVRVARERDLPLMVQGTGHGTLVQPDGAVLRTAGLTQVLVDPDRRVARVGAGVRWSDVIAAAEPFGLAPLSGDTPSVGVAGYTLGGGLSWLSRRYGFAANSLLKAELVTADGRLITVSERRDADLFWAIRGGGGNFGVVTSLEFRLHHVPEVYAGSAVFPIERAADALAFLSEHGPELPDELSLSLVITANSPIGAGPALVVRGVYAGTAQAGRRALQPLYAATGAPAVDGFRSMRYSEVGSIGGTPPRGFEMYDELAPDLVARIVDAVTRDDSGVQALEVKHWDGAIARPTHPSPGPVSHRDVPFVMKLDAAPGAVAERTFGVRDRMLVPQLPARHRSHRRRLHGGGLPQAARREERARPARHVPTRPPHPAAHHTGDGDASRCLTSHRPSGEATRDPAVPASTPGSGRSHLPQVRVALHPS